MKKVNKNLNRKQYKNKWVYLLFSLCAWLLYCVWKNPKLVTIAKQTVHDTINKDKTPNTSSKGGDNVESNNNSCESSSKICI